MNLDEMLAIFQNSETNEERVASFRSWRADLMLKVRKFVKDTQADFGARLNMEQQAYAKYEKPRGWKGHGMQIVELLETPTEMLQNPETFEEFIKADGAKTFVRLLEMTIERWTLPDGDAFADAELPVPFIMKKIGAQKNDEWRCNRVIQFLKNPKENDLDQEDKRWVESLLELEPGSIADPNFYNAKKLERKDKTNKLRNVFTGNVKQLLAERNWTAVKLAAEIGLPLSEIGDDENVVFEFFFMRHLVAVATVFQVPEWKLLMERGTGVERESAAAFSELPDYVRWTISFIYSAVKEEVNGTPTAAAQTVTGLLPVLVGVLKYAQQEAVRNPRLVDTARTLLTAFAPEMA